VTIVTGSRTGSEIDTEVVGYAYQPGGPASGEDPVILMPEQVAHFAPYRDPIARYRGVSWVQSVVEEITADGAATRHKRTFYEQGATLGYVVTLDGDMAPQKFDEWVKRFKAGHEGSLNAYKTLFLAGGADIKPVGTTMQQADLVNIQGAGETRICNAARVPAIIVGVTEGLESATYSNYAQARRAFADLTMRPMWRNIAASLAPIIDVPSDAELWYDDRDIPFLQEDVKDGAEIQQMQADTIHTLVIAGFEPDTAVKAVLSGDYGLLQHSGMYSVQLTPPGAVSEGKGALVGGAVVPAKNDASNGNGQPQLPAPAP
jgi:HK97 family phage portal protein